MRVSIDWSLCGVGGWRVLDVRWGLRQAQSNPPFGQSQAPSHITKKGVPAGTPNAPRHALPITLLRARPLSKVIAPIEHSSVGTARPADRPTPGCVIWLTFCASVMPARMVLTCASCVLSCLMALATLGQSVSADDLGMPSLPQALNARVPAAALQRSARHVVMSGHVVSSVFDGGCGLECGTDSIGA